MNSIQHLEPKSDAIAEKRLLGAITCDVESNREISKIAFNELIPEYFYFPDTKELFEFIKNRFVINQPYDIATLCGSVPDHLTDITYTIADERFYTISMFHEDLATLRKLYELRPKIQDIDNLFHSLRQINEPNECLRLISSSLASLQKDVVGRTDDCKDYEDLIDEVLQKPEQVEEIQTHLRDWPPFPNNCMITIAGRSGTGKTWAGLFFMDTILEAMPETKAVYFNLEMRYEIMLKRHLKLIGKYKNSLKNSLQQEGAAELLKKRVHMVSRPDISIDEIELIATSQNLQNKVSVIIVDYVGRVTAKGNEAEYQRQNKIAERLAGLALKLGCIVIPLQQVNRENKDAGAKSIPNAWEAAGSQGCERSSEWWLGIHKPDIYDREDPELKDLFIFQNRKQRGEDGYFTVYHDFKDGRFLEIDQQEAKNRYERATDKKTKSPLANYYKK